MIGSLVVIVICLIYITGWYFGHKQGVSETRRIDHEFKSDINYLQEQINEINEKEIHH